MNQDTKQLIDETIERVDTHWQKHRAPLLLSALGNVDGGRISREAKRLAESLRGFLDHEVGEQILVIQHSKRAPVLGVVPRNEDTKRIQDWDSLLETTSTNQPLRLHPALWAAFRKPVAGNMNRYILAGDSVRFVDVELGEDVPDGVPVDRALVSDPDEPPKAVYEKATAWLRDNHLDVSDFRAQAGSSASAKLPSNDLLGRLILALNSSDLQKLSIPMEIVAKLRRQPV